MTATLEGTTPSPAPGTTPGPAMAAFLAKQEREDAQTEATELEDFDQFWSASGRVGAELRNVFGVDVRLPAALPLHFEMKARRLADSESEEDTRELVAILFGPGTFTQWMDAGMDGEQFAVLLAWGVANAKGKPTTLAEARALYLEAEHAKDAGNRATRRAEGKARKPGKPGKTTTGGS